ncbi:MAG: hypothetical protein R2824_12005 [Saprospiraceae bacterium]|nr:hypothetical protein [Lewinella sp.]
MKTITVNQAITRGQQFVNYPITGIFILGFALSIFLPIRYQILWLIPIGLVLTFPLMWLWWSVAITYWRIWAFTNVRNVHELREKAVNRKLIWPAGSWFEKTEIRTTAQKQKLRELQQKFKLDDILEHINDDGKIPFETKIYYSKVTRWFSLLLALGMGSVALYLVIEGELYGYFIMVLTGLYSFFVLPKYTDTKPQIIVNEKGIKTVNTEFVGWQHVKKVSAKLIGQGKNAKWYLDMDFKKQDTGGNWGDQIEITDFDTSPNKLEDMVRLYRQRYREKN